MKTAFIRCFSLFLILCAQHINSFAIEPQKVIVVDFHGVVAQHAYVNTIKKLLTIVFKSPSRFSLLKLFVSPSFWRSVAKLNQYKSKDILFEKLGQQYPVIGQHIDSIFDAINCNEPNTELLETLKSLKANGYKVYLASNMGTRSYSILKQKLSDMFLDSVSRKKLFDGVFLVNKRDSNEQRYTDFAKPYTDYFIGLRRYISDKGVSPDAHIVFIDDRPGHLAALSVVDSTAQTILFKNPTQLKISLQNAGIAIQQNEV